MRLLAGVPTRSRPAAKPPILSGMDQIPSNDQNSLAGWRVDALAAVAHLNGGDVPPVVAAALRALAAALAAPDDLAAPAWPVLTERARCTGQSSRRARRQRLWWKRPFGTTSSSSSRHGWRVGRVFWIASVRRLGR